MVLKDAIENNDQESSDGNDLFYKRAPFYKRRVNGMSAFYKKRRFNNNYSSFYKRDVNAENHEMSDTNIHIRKKRDSEVTNEAEKRDLDGVKHVLYDNALQNINDVETSDDEYSSDK